LSNRGNRSRAGKAATTRVSCGRPKQRRDEMVGLIVLVLLVLAFASLAIGIYNRLVGLKNRAQGAWSDIDVQLKRRHDLVGNLGETVKGCAAHEKSTLESVIQARARAVSASQSGDAAAASQAEGFLTTQLRGLFALAEAHPDLQANTNFHDLQRPFEELEAEIHAAGRHHTAVERHYTTRLHARP